MKSFSEYNLMVESVHSTLDKLLAQLNTGLSKGAKMLGYDKNARGGRYIRVYTYLHYDGEEQQKSAVFFVDKNTGDVWKSASWKARSKTLWGNINNGGKEFMEFWKRHYSFYYN